MNDISNNKEKDCSGDAVPAWYKITLAVALFALGVIWGGFAVCHGFFPGKPIRDAYSAFTALKARHSYDNMEFSIDLWSSNRFGSASGVTRCDTNKTYNGLTIYTSGHTQGALLIDMDGRIVHEWRLPYTQIWEKNSGVKDPRPNHQIFWFKAVPFPNGDLLAVVEGNGSTPWGQGIIKIDKDSKLIWKFLECAHHDFSIGGDGRIYALTHKIRKEPIPGLGIFPPCLEDFVVVLSPDGKKIDELSIFEAFKNSRFIEAFNKALVRSGYGEYTHANAARVVNPNQSGLFPFSKAGQVLISMPLLTSSIALIDLETRRIEWSRAGSWRAQHDPDMLDNGNIMIFDNWGNTGAHGWSRVIEYNPANEKIEWSYSGNENNRFFSCKRSGQQLQPNGNVLIAESDAGRIFEVTRAGEIVWEYINPARAKNGELIAIISTGERYSYAYFEPEFVEKFNGGISEKREIKK